VPHVVLHPPSRDVTDISVEEVSTAFLDLIRKR